MLSRQYSLGDLNTFRGGNRVMVIRKTMMKMTENFRNVNHLVLNFYPDGYSIAVKLNEFPVFTSETILETAKISYEETSLLDYIENEELPPILVEMIDGSPKLSQYKIWHNGCLILEVRDKINIVQEDNNNKNNVNDISNNISYSTSQNTAKEFLNHQNYSSSHHLDAQWMSNNTTTTTTSLNNNNNNSHSNLDNGIDSSESVSTNKTATTNSSYFILLKPTNLSMLNDVLNLTESNLWSAQDRLQLESQIVLHNSPPLFLEPDATKQPPELSSWPNTKLCNIHTRHKKKLPHNKLKKLYSSNIEYGKNNINYNINNSNGNNIDKSDVYQSTAISLPPELTLQQFLATKRARKKTYNAGYLARFHRFKKHSNNHIK